MGGFLIGQTSPAEPYLFFADANGMFKDNGSFSVPQSMGIFQPRYPVSAQSQNPSLITLDNYTTLAGTYTYTGIGGGANATYVNTTLTLDHRVWDCKR